MINKKKKSKFKTNNKISYNEYMSMLTNLTNNQLYEFGRDYFDFNESEIFTSKFDEDKYKE